MNTTEKDTKCIFCNIKKIDKIICESEHVIAFLDLYPVTPGHTLIIPKEHVINYFDISPALQNEMWNLVNRCKEILDNTYHPNGYNIGININKSAGQTILHTHIHLIPRYSGDTQDPKGGVRGVIAEKQKY